MQFDDAMLESELDAMIRTRVEDAANAMPDASGRRDRGRRRIRARDRSEGVPGRPLRARADGRVGNVGIPVAVGIDADGRRGRIRANDTIGRPNREIRRRTRVAGGFPDGSGALMPVCAGIRCVTANGWPTSRYLDTPRLGGSLMEAN